MADSDAWLVELAALGSTGIARPFRARARKTRHLRSNRLGPPLPFLAYRMVRDGRRTLWEHDAVAILYPPDAEAGAEALAVVPLQADAPIDRIHAGDIVEARGIPQPGHAMVLLVGDVVIPCAGPVWRPTVLRRPFRL